LGTYHFLKLLRILLEIEEFCIERIENYICPNHKLGTALNKDTIIDEDYPYKI
jgi:hypothetical protein